MSNAAARSHCLRAVSLRLTAVVLPLLLVQVLVWLGLGPVPAAVLVFHAAVAVGLLGTLLPRCALFGPMIKRLPEEPGKVLLTIDDGPHPAHTLVFLDLLDRHGIKAVFFLIGERAAAHPELVREIIRRGHEVGNHTQTHPAGSFWSLSPARMWQEIAGCQETLTAICPEHPPRFFRPPAGHHNPFAFRVARRLGLRMMMWSVRGFDGVKTNVADITARIRPGVKPGAIVLIHEATPVAVEVAESITALIAASGLDCGTPPSSLAFAND